MLSPPLIKSWKLKKKFLYVTCFISQPWDIYLHVDWDNGLRSKILVPLVPLASTVPLNSIDNNPKLKIKVKGCPGPCIRLYLVAEGSFAKGDRGCLKQTCALNGELAVSCNCTRRAGKACGSSCKTIPCCSGEPDSNGICRDEISNNILYSLRISPVTLRDDIYNRWEKEGPLVRISWVGTKKCGQYKLNGILKDWSFTKNFPDDWGWNKNGVISVQSSVIAVKDKLEIPISNNQYQLINIIYPTGRNPNTLIMGDPQINGNPDKFYSDSQSVHTRVVNKFLDQNKLDVVVYNGDIFYDYSAGGFNRDFYAGMTKPEFFYKLTIASIGNHDYSPNGASPLTTGGYGRQYLLWYGVDSHTSLWIDPNDSKVYNKSLIPWQYTFSYYAIGTTGFIVSDNSQLFNDDMKAICRNTIIPRFETLGITTVHYISHWDLTGDFGVQTTQDVYNILKSIFAEKQTTLKLKYFFTGHVHENYPITEGTKTVGYLAGGNGRCPGNCLNAKCEQNPNCCPTFLDSDGSVHQGWGTGGPCNGI